MKIHSEVRNFSDSVCWSRVSNSVCAPPIRCALQFIPLAAPTLQAREESRLKMVLSLTQSLGLALIIDRIERGQRGIVKSSYWSNAHSIRVLSVIENFMTCCLLKKLTSPLHGLPSSDASRRRSYSNRRMRPSNVSMLSLSQLSAQGCSMTARRNLFRAI